MEAGHYQLVLTQRWVIQQDCASTMLLAQAAALLLLQLLLLLLLLWCSLLPEMAKMASLFFVLTFKPRYTSRELRATQPTGCVRYHFLSDSLLFGGTFFIRFTRRAKTDTSAALFTDSGHKGDPPAAPHAKASAFGRWAAEAQPKAVSLAPTRADHGRSADGLGGLPPVFLQSRQGGS